jgi:KaiC/GvpD/RAD55 family RecA-like ATPase
VKDAAGLLKLDTRPSNILEFKAEPETATPLFKRIGLDDVTPPVWLVKSHIEEGTFAMVFGPSGAKKSFLVYDLACCIATGKDWHGNRVKQGAVLIICGEGHGGLNRRLKGWEKYNQQSLKDVPLYGNERPLTLTDDADIEALIAYIEERISIDGTPNLIVVDTLARALGAADEKSGADINKLIVSLTAVIQQYKCAVLLVHHAGHSDAAKHRARGASELPAAVDHEFLVEPYEEAGIITGTLFASTKMKDASLGEPVVFDMITVGLGVCDEDMVEIDTLVPELRGPAQDYRDNLPDSMIVVIDEEYKLRQRNEMTKRALIDAVRVELGCAKRTTERWVKQAIEEGRINV